MRFSDRLAVFNLGRIEQVGAPFDIYEHPATPFVADFVGVSNLVSGETAQAITGSAQMFSIRPEKIHLSDPSAVIPNHMFAADGRIRDVVYLGILTRYFVELNVGGDLTVVEQNLNTSSKEALLARGREVRLLWYQHHCRYIPSAS